jgi:hypothetical protein
VHAALSKGVVTQSTMSHVASNFHTDSIAFGTSFRPARLPRSDIHGPIASSNYPVFKGPIALYTLRMMPDGIAFVLTSSNERAGVPSAKNRFPVPNRTG